jgi:signal transduction histidine kinase
MTFDKRIKDTNKLFVLSMLGVVLLTIVGMGLALYSAEVITFGKSAKVQELHNLAKENPELTSYLIEQKEYDAHFVTIANLISNDKKNDITMAFIYSAFPIIIISAFSAYLVAKRLLKPVKEAYESQERFLQDAAHELRNPIAAINIALENATTTKLSPAKEKELIKMVGRQTRRLVRINEDLLFLERRQNNQQAIPETDVSVLLEDVIEGLQITVNKRDINLNTNITPNLTKRIRPNDFIKLSRNIIENAIKYSPDKSTIDITLSKEKRIIFIVKDNGVGIPSQEIDKLGERFFRASNTGKFEGSGLGLAIVKKIINNYGGDIKIASQTNKGTKIIITL